ncbi:hypothetical protein YC2023_010366 [Brassica napus]
MSSRTRNRRSRRAVRTSTVIPERTKKHRRQGFTHRLQLDSRRTTDVDRLSCQVSCLSCFCFTGNWMHNFMCLQKCRRRPLKSGVIGLPIILTLQRSNTPVAKKGQSSTRH